MKRDDNNEPTKNNLNMIKVCSCTGSLTMRPQSTYLTCTHTLPHAIPALGTICLG